MTGSGKCDKHPRTWWYLNNIVFNLRSHPDSWTYLHTRHIQLLHFDKIGPNGQEFTKFPYIFFPQLLLSTAVLKNKVIALNTPLMYKSLIPFAGGSRVMSLSLVLKNILDWWKYNVIIHCKKKLAIVLASHANHFILIIYLLFKIFVHFYLLSNCNYIKCFLSCKLIAIAMRCAVVCLSPAEHVEVWSCQRGYLGLSFLSGKVVGDQTSKISDAVKFKWKCVTLHQADLPWFLSTASWDAERL